MPQHGPPGDPHGRGSVPAGTDIHGSITENPILLALLDAGNRLRYGKSEAERQADVQGLRTPGVKDAAYTGPLKTFDPAAAERYTSAYEFGDRFNVPEALQPALHSISSGGRSALHRVPALAKMFGVGEERPELAEAERLGMKRGAAGSKGFLAGLFGQ
jgi:hypothetical protein